MSLSILKNYCILVFLLLAPGTFRCLAQELPYPAANDQWNTDSLGNHRAIIQVTGHQPIAKAKVYWRRHDRQVAEKEIILVDAATGKRVTNIYTPEINREYVTLYFEHIKGHRVYYLYYMPFRHKGSVYYPQDYYPPRTYTADKSWLASVKKITHFAEGHLAKLQPVTPFNSFSPMEIIATKSETDSLITANSNADYLVFPEDRLHPIKMNYDLPYRWIKAGVNHSFVGEAKKGEYYAFQLGIYAAKKGLKDVRIKFSSLKSDKGDIISDTLFSCINTKGISYAGEPVEFTVDIPHKCVQAMWCYLKVPEDIPPGDYSGTATVTAEASVASPVLLHIHIGNDRIENHGVDEPWKMTRLPWLNSTIGQDNDVIKPYTPLKVDGHSISFLGRDMQLAPSGLPEQVRTFFPIEMTSISNRPNDLLVEAMHFHFIGGDNKEISLNSGPLIFTEKAQGTVEWKVKNTSQSLEADIMGHIEFDGFVSYQVKVIALRNIRLNDIALHIPIAPDKARYFMGLGHKGGFRPDSINWRWDVAHKNQDGGWIGDVNAGLQFSLRDQHYSRPLNTNFYLMKPLILPTSWGNGNRGGIIIKKKGKSILVNAFSGPRVMQKGDTLFYDFHLLITPFHPLYTDWHWKHKYYHNYTTVDSIKAMGANVINIHQGKFPNPYINYPFIGWRQLKAFVDSAHQENMDVKIYNTIRELANRAYELYPLRSLGTEIFSPGKGGGYPWLQEHLDSNYIAGWYTPETNDAAIVNGGQSRWHNYYIQGLNWLVERTGIDGLYLDDVAYDRVTMKRVKRMLLKHGHAGIIDLHSANQYNKADGWNNSANLYMSLFPYLNRLWFGEYFDYNNNSPDFFLTEVSGIPFGLMGEMLQDGGNAWRGMLYGMTSRLPWTAGDPRPIWNLWNEFHIEGSRMIGYWVPDCPVKTDNPKVLATVFTKDGEAMVSLASWAKADVTIHLNIDWKYLGLNPSRIEIIAPPIKDFQSSAKYKADEAIRVDSGKGLILLMKETAL